jgi:ubiquinone/menaquinone biosynthesis C-methylase UbiE
MIKKLLVNLYNKTYYFIKSPFVKKFFSAIGRLTGIAVKEKYLPIEDPDYFKVLTRHSVRYWDILNILNKYEISGNLLILDVGCGTGNLSMFLINHGYKNIHGCDWISMNDFSQERQNKINYQTVNLNKEGLSKYPDNFADVVICSEVIEHLENPSAIFREFSRVLKPNGIAFISLPNAFNIMQRLNILFTGNSTRYSSEVDCVPHGHISMLPFETLNLLCDMACLEIHNREKSTIAWNNHIWFFPRKFSALYSYCDIYVLQKKNQI